MYRVYEQIETDNGIEYRAVTALYRTVQQCERDKDILEKRFREDELSCRSDWRHRESSDRLRASLKGIGSRKRTRHFVVRRANYFFKGA